MSTIFGRWSKEWASLKIDCTHRCGTFLLLFISAAGFGQSQSGVKTDNLSDFRPRRELPNQELVGRQVCAGCHMQKNRSQLQTAMAHALSLAADSRVLQSHPRLTFRSGVYTYEITTEGQQVSYRVTDGKRTISEPVAYVFGNAHVAQTYILRHDGKLYEGRVSYYTAIENLDWTIGDALNPPPSLEAAFGRDISGDEARNCFTCHGTGAVVDGKLQLDHLTPGVTCEACHGPGRGHVEAMHSGLGEGLSILNPRTLSPDTLSQEFCGACHRSANTVGMMPDLGGITNVRFQPYRLSGSPGHDPNDPHFACTACHDPHVDLPLQGASADSKCADCHTPTATASGSPSQTKQAPSKQAPSGKVAASSPVAKPCPVANANCDSCHMPRVEIPGTHFKFTDHRIRIVRPGTPYPL